MWKRLKKENDAVLMHKKTQYHTDICSHQTDLLFNGISFKIPSSFLWNSQNNYKMYNEDRSFKIPLYKNSQEIQGEKKKKKKKPTVKGLLFQIPSWIELNWIF